MPHPLSAALLAAVVLAAPLAPASPASAQAPGFWVYSADPALSDAALHDLCMDGMTVILDADHWLSLLAVADATGSRLIVDAEAACASDAEGHSDCAVAIYDPAQGVGRQRLRIAHGRTPEGHPTMRTTVVETGAVSDSYPQACPPEAVRDLLVGWLAPRP